MVRIHSNNKNVCNLVNTGDLLFFSSYNHSALFIKMVTISDWNHVGVAIMIDNELHVLDTSPFLRYDVITKKKKSGVCIWKLSDITDRSSNDTTRDNKTSNDTTRDISSSSNNNEDITDTEYISIDDITVRYERPIDETYVETEKIEKNTLTSMMEEVDEITLIEEDIVDVEDTIDTIDTKTLNDKMIDDHYNVVGVKRLRYNMREEAEEFAWSYYREHARDKYPQDMALFLNGWLRKDVMKQKSDSKMFCSPFVAEYYRLLALRNGEKMTIDNTSVESRFIMPNDLVFRSNVVDEEMIIIHQEGSNIFDILLPFFIIGLLILFALSILLIGLITTMSSASTYVSSKSRLYNYNGIDT